MILSNAHQPIFQVEITFCGPNHNNDGGATSNNFLQKAPT